MWEYKKCDITSFRNAVKNTNWPRLFHNKTIDEMTDVFTNTFLSSADRLIPSKIINVDDKEAPWISPHLRLSSQKGI